MLRCEKIRSTNADVAGTLKRRENGDLKQLFYVREKFCVLVIVTIYGKNVF